MKSREGGQNRKIGFLYEASGDRSHQVHRVGVPKTIVWGAEVRESSRWLVQFSEVGELPKPFWNCRRTESFHETHVAGGETCQARTSI